jgi:hypothetical protein
VFSVLTSPTQFLAFIGIQGKQTRCLRFALGSQGADRPPSNAGADGQQAGRYNNAVAIRVVPGHPQFIIGD